MNMISLYKNEYTPPLACQHREDNKIKKIKLYKSMMIISNNASIWPRNIRLPLTISYFRNEVSRNLVIHTWLLLFSYFFFYLCRRFQPWGFVNYWGTRPFSTKNNHQWICATHFTGYVVIFSYSVLVAESLN
jgi:hypothetical protein